MRGAKKTTSGPATGLTLVLTFVGGYVDGACYLILDKMFTAHMSGNSIAMSLHVAHEEWPQVVHRGFPILVFVAGVLIGAFANEWFARGVVRAPFAILFGFEVLLLVIFVGGGLPLSRAELLPFPRVALYYTLAALPALAMGLQNATLRRAAGLPVRTTYITGALTDFAEEAAHYLHWFAARWHSWGRLRPLARLTPRQPSFWNALFFLSIWFSYVIGGIAGGIGLYVLGLACLWIPCALLSLAAAADLIRPVSPWGKNLPKIP